MDPYVDAISRIIKEQQVIIGPVALEQAKKVSGLELGGVDDVKITGNKKEVLTNLVNQYAKLFGQASVEVCKDAVRPLISQFPKNQIPSLLQ